MLSASKRSRTDHVALPSGQLARGDSLVIQFQLTLRERHWDGFVWYEAGRVFGPGNRWATNTPLKCTITAS